MCVFVVYMCVLLSGKGKMLARAIIFSAPLPKAAKERGYHGKKKPCQLFSLTSSKREKEHLC